MLSEETYTPTSPAIVRIAHASWHIASNVALSNRPAQQAKKLHINNVQLLSEALQHITDPACQVRAQKTISRLMQLIEDLEEAA